MPSIALDMGGTAVKIGIVSDGHLVASSIMEAEPGSPILASLDKISSRVVKLLQTQKISKAELCGIGIAFPGIVDSANKTVLSDYVKYKGAKEFDFSRWAEEEWGMELALENDARAALAGEWQFGAGKGFQNIVLLTIGTGIGSAVLMDGKLLRGAHNLGGNLAGHMCINVNGSICNCGYFGCVETESSTWILREKAAHHPGLASSSLAALPEINFQTLFEHASKKDQLAEELLNQSLVAWGVCAINMVHSHDPEIIIIGGGVMKQAEIILPFLQNMVDKYTWLAPGTMKIIPAAEIQFASLLGMDYILTHTILQK